MLITSNVAVFINVHCKIVKAPYNDASQSSLALNQEVWPQGFPEDSSNSFHFFV